jgi:drug/metabolite transporter (DMT)-like permease
VKGSRRIWLLAASAIVPWGASFIVNKVALRELGPANLSFYDWLVGTAFLCAYVVATRRRPPVWATLRRQPLIFVAMALFLIPIPYLLQNFALQRTTVINVSILLDSDPVFLVILGVLLLGEHVTWIQAAGVATALIGTAVITLNGGSIDLASGGVAGSLMALCAAFSLSIYSILAKVALRQNRAFVTALLTAGLGTALLLLPAWAEGLSWPGNWSASVWLAILFLGIACSGWGVLAWFRILNELDASRAAPLVFFIPLIAATLSILLLKEQPTIYTLVGAVLIFAGVVTSERGAKDNRLQQTDVDPVQAVERA